MIHPIYMTLAPWSHPYIDWHILTRNDKSGTFSVTFSSLTVVEIAVRNLVPTDRMSVAISSRSGVRIWPQIFASSMQR
jgi:hypothetical protein